MSFMKKPKVSKPKPVVVPVNKEQEKAEKARQADDDEARRRRASLWR